MDRKLRAQTINNLVDDLLISYKEEERVQPHGACPMPNRNTIIKIAKQMRKLIFPGYFNGYACSKDILQYHTGELLVNVQRLICKREEMIDKATNLSFKILSKLPTIREYLSTDVQGALDGDPAASSLEEIIFSYPGIFSITMHRIAHEMYLLNIPLIPRILSEYSHSITGIDINPGAQIGKYFFIDHGTGVVIGETTIIGNNVKIYQGVTLGALSTRGGQKLKGSKRHPTIEDGVTIYSGASVLGGDTVIGEGATIGGNAFITDSVPKGTKVSVKNPELILKNREHRELEQDYSEV